MEMGEETLVVVVGAGPAGLAISACLSLKSIPCVVLEKEDCCASLWKKRTYDRCHLHLAKEFCSLPFKPHAPKAKKFMPKDDFIQYIDDYVTHFNIKPRYCHSVESASFDKSEEKWWIEALDTKLGVTRIFMSTFLVVASGENNEGYIPDIPGLKSFKGDVLHSSQYKSGSEYQDKEVLVVGCGNSGMEICYDLSTCGANASIVIRNPLHVVTREMICVGMHLLKYIPVSVVDILINLASKIKFKDLSKYGIHRPNRGPFMLKMLTGRSPVIDVGAIAKIKTGEIKVYPSMSRIYENNVEFEDQVVSRFDAIIFATGYKSKACEWLKDYEYVLKDNGSPRNRFPNHWKGENRLYCAGLSKMGLDGVSRDAKAIADDILNILSSN